MKTNNKNQRTLLSLALIASLSATALFVASAEEQVVVDAGVTMSPAAHVASPASIQAPAAIPTSPVIELPPTTTVAGDPTVDATKAISAEAPLEPGDYTWNPEASPSGEVVILVSLPKQELSVYRGGVRIARSSVSSGKPGQIGRAHV